MAASKKPAAVQEPKKNLPAKQLDFAADAGAGMEGADAAAFAIPFLAIIQSNSPQLKDGDSKFIKGAKVGHIFNTVTNHLYDGKTGVLMVPAAYQRRFLRWAPRGQEGGGFRGELMPEAAQRMRESGELVEFENRTYVPLADGTVNPKKCDRVSDTRNHFIIVVDQKTGTFNSALLSLSSTQIKKSRTLMSNLSGVKVTGKDGKVFTPPTFAMMVRATTVPEQNDQGSWYGWKFDIEGHVEDAAIYNAARDLNRNVAKGAVNVQHEASPNEDSEKF